MSNLEITLVPTPAPNSGEGAAKLSSNAGVYFRNDKYLVMEIVKLLRRVFRYNGQIANKGLEYLNFVSGSVPSIYEIYSDAPESYPRVVVAGLGGTNSGMGFNHLQRTCIDDSYEMGERGVAYTSLNVDNSILIQLPDLENNTLEALEVAMGWSGIGLEEDINIEIYENYDTTPNLVASGSIAAFSESAFKTHRLRAYPQVALSGSSNWARLSCSASVGGYNVGIDTYKTDLRYAVNSLGSGISTGSVVGRALLPPFLRFGGNKDSTISIRCMAKNNSNLARDLADTVESGLYALSQGKVSREDHAVGGVELTRTKTGVQSEWDIKEFYVKNVRQGALEVRDRGDNDKIYIAPITVDVLSSWFRDYPAYPLDGVNLEFEAY